MKTTLALTAIAAAAAVVEAKLDSNLHRSFYGIAYSSDGTVLPNCGATQQQVTEDILLIAQLTPRLRTYGSDCNQTSLVMQAINETNVDLLYYPTIYIEAPYNQTVVDRQLAAVKEAFTTYGIEKIGGLTVGNEFLLDSYGSSGTPTDSNGVNARTELLQSIQTINKTIAGWGLSKSIPIGTSDAASAVTEQLCAGIDYFMANDHPWFGNVPVNMAAGWTWNFLEQNPVAVCSKAANNPAVYIGETGWPTASDNASQSTSGGSPASVADLNTFLGDFVCTANTNKTDYFFFSFQDSVWAGQTYGGVEGHWGLFDKDRNLKSGLTLPNCPVDSPLGGTVDQSIAAQGDSTSVSGVLSATGDASKGKSSGSSSSSKSGALASASASAASILTLVAAGLHFLA